MSLILEALRKSEAERRRGQAPGLFVEQVPVATRRREGTPVWAWILMAVLAAVLLAWGWREFGAHRASTTPETSIVAEAPPAILENVAREAAAPASSEASARSVAPAPVADVAPAYPPPARAEPVEAAALSPRPEAPAPAVAAETRAPVAAEPDLARETPAPLPPSNADAEDESLPRLSELTGDERSYLPALKLTMHVFADEPAQRFVILDGRRLREGDGVAEGVVVDRIRRDGLVLSVNGRRVLLARP